MPLIYFAVHRSVLRNTLHNCRRCTCIRPYFPSKSGDEPCISALHVVGCVTRRTIYHCTCQNMENACLQQLGHPDTGDCFALSSLQYCVCHLDCMAQRLGRCDRVYLLSPMPIVESVTKTGLSPPLLPGGGSGSQCCKFNYVVAGASTLAAAEVDSLAMHICQFDYESKWSEATSI